MSPRLLARAVMLFALAGSGCATLQPLSARPTAANPIFVRANNYDGVWERTVDVLHDYQFPVEQENKIDGVIRTEFKVGSSLLEPWHYDSVGFANRLESSLQSIRRQVIVHVTPAEGGYFVGVEAFKFLEDLAGGYAETTVGGATFDENRPLARDLGAALGQSSPSGWVLMGRDPALEQALLQSLQARYAR